MWREIPIAFAASSFSISEPLEDQF